MNSKREIIAVNVYVEESTKRLFKISKINSEGKYQTLFSKEGNFRIEIESSTIDGENNVYCVTRFEPADSVYHYKLIVLDTTGDVKYHYFELEFLNGNCPLAASAIVVSEDRKEIFIHAGKHVYVCDSSGQLKYNFFWKRDLRKFSWPFLTRVR